eukprot:CAMPEP_0171121932 /NCGR_PEP_ID=MMETSP0766_2-20121228/103831_1 /TAXON_ID=439317 /ORGANISM="Gambierdiscus australes, Strain CAWD 149" /LENGTH=48 /DNA_ID= /DNA_START= /DNA_END= /DNA_ORIENTATION=
MDLAPGRPQRALATTSPGREHLPAASGVHAPQPAPAVLLRDPAQQAVL